HRAAHRPLRSRLPKRLAPQDLGPLRHPQALQSRRPGHRPAHPHSTQGAQGRAGGLPPPGRAGPRHGDAPGRGVGGRPGANRDPARAADGTCRVGGILLTKARSFVNKTKDSLLLPFARSLVITPPLESPTPMPPRRRRPWPLPWWARGLLVLFALVALTTFTIAVCLDPYEGGRVWQAETHTQLGLPACTFKRMTGLPCASCGMSTSFALAVRGDLWHSLQANWVGTLLALFGMVFVPWAL